MSLKTFHFQIAVKSVQQNEDDKSVTIQGYASTPDIDRYNDIVKPEAFASALTMFMKNPSLLRSHDPDRPCGHVTQARITDQGLWIEAQVTESETAEDVMANRMRAFSIGYIPLESTLQHPDGTPFNAETDSVWDPKLIRVITKLDLVEISLTATPANGNALFTIAKSVKQYFNQLAIKSMKINTKEIENEAGDEVVEPADEVVDGAEATDGAETTETAADEAKDGGEAVETPEKPAEDAPEETVDETTSNTTDQGQDGQDEAEKAGETPAADAGEAVTGDEPGTEAKPEADEAEDQGGDDGVAAVDAETAKSLSELVTAGLLKESKDAEALKLPKQIVGLISKLTTAYLSEAKRADELQKKLETTPEKKALVVHGQFNEDKKTEEKSPKTASNEFKALFGLK